MQQQIDTTIHLNKDVKEKEIPYGHIKFYPGKKNLSNNQMLTST